MSSAMTLESSSRVPAVVHKITSVVLVKYSSDDEQPDMEAGQASSSRGSKLKTVEEHDGPLAAQRQRGEDGDRF